MNSLLKRWLRRAGVVISTTRHAGARYIEEPPSNEFESVLLRLFVDLRNLRFVQVGANDGVQADPIHRYVAKYQWSGLMLEPVGRTFRTLEQNFRSCSQVRCLQAAVDANAGTRVIYEIKPDIPGLPPWARGLASFDRARLSEAATHLGLDDFAIQSEEVRTVSWQDVWRVFGHAECDLLVIDTEGQDIRLLGLAELDRRRPRVILFEHGCNSMDERLGFYRTLLDYGYELSTQGSDTIAYLPLSIPHPR